MRVTVAGAVLLVLVRCSSAWAGPSAAEILEASGIRGGLVVQLGCGDGKLTAALRAGDAFLVEGLDTDPGNVEEARAHLRSLGLGGKVTADVFDGRHLPYVDNLVSLVVAEDLGEVSTSEVMRVLSPGGVAYVQRDGTWTGTVKPWPDGIDEWTHWLHGADGNAVADDEVVGPPRHVQWVDGPIWSRHHEMVPSVSAMVTSGGRIFSICDEAPAGVCDLPDRWCLLARDAFNGVLLWRRPLADWGWKAWSAGQLATRFNQPLHVPRRLVAVGERVYATLGFNAPVVALDAATGRTVRTYAGTEHTSEFGLCDGTLFVAVNQAAQKPGQIAADPPVKKQILAIEAETGKLLWTSGDYVGIASKMDALERITHLTLAVGGRCVVFLTGDELVCLDRNTGTEKWSVPRPVSTELPGRYHFRCNNLCSLVVHEKTVLFAQPVESYERGNWNDATNSRLWALSAETGQTLWTHDCGTWGPFMPPDVFVIQGLVWVHDADPYALVGLDPATGAVKRKISTKKAMDQGHHHRCYRNKATLRYVLTGRRGVEFIGLASEENLLHHWTRGTCRFGVLPSCGLLYVPPHPCVCYITAKLNGLFALAPERPVASGADVPGSAAPRLERGAAYDHPIEPRGSGRGASEDWPTYRHDARRSGSTRCSVPARLQVAWRAEVGGKPTSPVIAAGKVLVASVDAHSVHALKAADGEPAWSCVVGGRVDTPPTVYQGRALFGSADGRVYCVRASDGRLIWRRRAAPGDRRLVAFGQVESAWPVHGSVLVEDGVAYVNAGRSSFLDGGIHVCAIDPQTGRLLQERCIYSPDPKTGEMLPCRSPYDMPPERPGALPDVFVSDGRFLYMRHVRLDPKDLHRPAAPTIMGPPAQRRSDHPGLGPQLISNAGLLDDTWFNQTYWTVGAGSHGKLLVFDDEAAYGVKPYRGTARHSRAAFRPGRSGYKLFANQRRPGAERWSVQVPIRVKSMLLAGETLFVAGPPDVVDPEAPWAAFEGRRGGLLWALSAEDGRKLAEYRLDAPPVFDGMAAADGRLFVSTQGGHVLCMEGRE
jgi:outer membrane protein assembly factor BamB